MTVYLITAVNRGIGFALLDQLSQDSSNTVIGTVRSLKNAQTVLDLKRSNVHLFELEILADIETYKTAFKKIDDFAPKGIDVVIHNAGVVGAHNLSSVFEYKAEDYKFPFEVNVIGSVKVYQSVAPYLYKGEGKKTLLFISSLAGRITNSKINFNGYGASKAALNYFMRQAHLENQASELPVKKNAVVYSIHPGLVETDMAREAIKAGGNILAAGVITAPESASRIIKTLPNAASGTFVNNDGSVSEF